MASSSDDRLWNNKHCVLIDGDFGRHELFSEVHPYRLSRLSKSNDIAAFQIQTQEAMQLMNKTYKIHYHICYTEVSNEINDYYKALKLLYPQTIELHPLINTQEDRTFENAVDKCRNQCDYMWIIYGKENHHQELIKQLRSWNDSTIHISSYSWLENLIDGSNRIEYLFNYKIKTLVEQQINEPGETVKTQSNTMENPVEILFESVDSLQTTPPAKLSKCQQRKQKAAATSTTQKSRRTCDFVNCTETFRRQKALRKHQLQSHPIPLRCPYTEQCLSSTQKYQGVGGLSAHIISQHEKDFTPGTCPFVSCQNLSKRSTWLDTIDHVVKCHNKYLFNETILTTNKPELINPNSNSTIGTTIIPSWDFNTPLPCSFHDCTRTYNDEGALKRHEVYEHPVPLSCPFSIECQLSHRKHVGLRVLRRHLESKHASSFAKPTCYDPRCQQGEEKPFKTWSSVVRHLAEQHLDGLGIHIQSNATMSTRKNTKIWKKCSYETCDQLFNNLSDFQKHLVKQHPFPLRCPYSPDCNRFDNQNQGYFGRTEFEQHIQTVHASKCPRPICFHETCQRDKNFQDWSTIIEHIISKHWTDVKAN